MKTLFFFIFFTLLFSFSLVAQDRLLTGKVTDTKGNPLPGVNVSAKDYPAITTISGVDGEFRLEVFDFTKALIFSFTNMKTKEVALNDTIDRILVSMGYQALKNPNPWSVLLNITSGQSHVYNESKDKNPLWEYHGEPGFISSIEVEYFFTQNIGISAGFGFSSYNSSAFVNSLDNTANNIERVDMDNDTYFLYTNGTELHEKTKARTIGFPIKIKLRFRPGKKWSFNADLGIKLLNVAAAKVKAQGQTEWLAYYPQYSAVIFDIADYGYTMYDINSENTLINYNKNMQAFIASAGISRQLNKNLNIDLGLYVERGLSDLGYNEPVHEADYINTVGEMGETSLDFIGLQLSLRYQIIKSK
jgi:hypothetical protein